MVSHKRRDIGESMDETDDQVLKFLKEICPGEYQAGMVCYTSMSIDGESHSGTAICGRCDPLDLLNISANMMATTSKIFKDASIALAQLTKKKQEVTDEECAEAGAAILVAATVAQAELKDGRQFKYMED